jgi:Tfp pilus assembly protein PilN
VRFQINIYRPGRGTKKVPKQKEEERRISIAILIPVMVFLLLGIIFFYMKLSSTLDRKIKMNRTQRIYLSGQLSQVERDLEKATEEQGLISQLQVKKVEWSQKLLDLSKIMPDNLWLTDLSIKTTEKRKKGSREVEEETYLTIKGVTVPMPGREPLDSIAHLISSLNSLDSYQRDFNAATLVYTHLSREKDRELMEFEISSKFKDGLGMSREKASR